ncbi:type II/IV secretion system ATPase subunit [Candidatus Pacearchaeota archaeon]|nr:hypothetical protein [uncultured archaeon]MBS3073778.1 type II/IV secretion system ATPase subunit [Candidatus Pacearchaeota archaeon]
MLFKPGTQLYGYENIREGNQEVIYFNYLGAPFVPGIADSNVVMSRVIDALTEVSNATKIVFVQQRNYVHTFNQVKYLIDLSQLYTALIKQEKVLLASTLELGKCQKHINARYETMRYLILGLLKQDPVAMYFELKRFIEEQKINLTNALPEDKACEDKYLKILQRILSMLEKTSLIQQIIQRPDLLKGYVLNSREIYNQFFRPEIVPNFTFTRLMASLPEDGEIVEEYEIGTEFDKSIVTILKIPGKNKYLYHLNPPEFSLDEELQELVNVARNVLLEHKPKAEEFTDPERIRQVFFNIAKDLLGELSESRKIKLTYKNLNKLSSILVRYTIGFGLIEVLLLDENLQDISVNSPAGAVPIFVRHNEFDECDSNIVPSQEDVDSWAAKFRMISGRPLDEANPILDTELEILKARARVAIIQQPLSPDGVAYSFRRHRDKPWTMPLFIKNKMISSLSAGLMSFLIDGGRTLLVAGTRSSGKTSFLGACMLEIMQKYRVIVLEDTLELPVNALRDLNFDILRMKVRGALLKESTEVSAEEGIRTSLRLGDSCLIVGEVRSTETSALYEAMRVGALANVVAGTIHGASPYGVFDRVVNDLKVPATSFKATDIITIVNPIKSADGIHRFRRMLQIAEVRKHWKEDPAIEHGFLDLMKYDVLSDEIKPTEDLINGESEVLKEIAGNVRGWAGNWDAVWENIKLRADMKQSLVDFSIQSKMPGLLEGPFVVRSNSIFHEMSEKIQAEVGVPENKRVLKEFNEWLKKNAKKV